MRRQGVEEREMKVPTTYLGHKELKERQKNGARMNQHPPVHLEGWMVSGQETVFFWIPVP
jgi:hypothetical protein